MFMWISLFTCYKHIYTHPHVRIWLSKQCVGLFGFKNVWTSHSFKSEFLYADMHATNSNMSWLALAHILENKLTITATISTGL